MTQYQLGAPSWYRKIFFGLLLYLAERCCENLQSARGLARCKSGPATTWLVDVTIYCTIFQKQFSISPSTSPVFTHKILLKKLSTENADWTDHWTSIEGAWASWRTCTPTTGYFHDEIKISKKNLRVDCYLLLKWARDNAPYFPLPGPNHLLLKFKSKMQDVKRVVDLNCK